MRSPENGPRHWTDVGPRTCRGRSDRRAWARVVLVGRTRSRLTGPLHAHRRTGVDRFPIVVADMASLALSPTRSSTEGRLDVLIDNAGAIFPDRRETGDGIEATFATMVVGPFARCRDCSTSCDGPGVESSP